MIWYFVVSWKDWRNRKDTSRDMEKYESKVGSKTKEKEEVGKGTCWL